MVALELQYHGDIEDREGSRTVARAGVIGIILGVIWISETAAAPTVVEDFENGGPCVSELARETSLGTIADDCMFYLDHGNPHVIVATSVSQVHGGSRSLEIANIPSNPPPGNYPWVTLGLSQDMISQLQTAVSSGASNIGFWVRSSGGASRIAVKVSSSGWGRGTVLYEGRTVVSSRWQYVSWYLPRSLGDSQISLDVFRFDFFNDSTAPLTIYIDDLQIDGDVTTTPPEAPTRLSASGGILSAHVTWDALTAGNISVLRLERSTAGGASFSVRATIPPHHTSFVDYAFPINGADVQYRLIALDSSGNLSDYSNLATTTVLPFDQSEELHARIENVVSAVSSEGSDFQTYFPWGYDQRDLDQFTSIDADYMYRGWFVWGCEAGGEDFTSATVFDLFAGAAAGPETVQENGGVFGGGVPLSAMCVNDVPIEGYQSMMPFWQGEKLTWSSTYPMQCLKGTCPGPSLIVHHAGAQMASGAASIVIDSATPAQYTSYDWWAITNMLRLKALELYEQGKRAWPDVLVGRIWSSRHVDFQTNVGNSFFLHGGCPGVNGDVEQLGNGAFLDADGNRITGSSCGSRSAPVAHLDNTITKFNYWHYVAYDDLNGMEKYTPGKPKFFALDIPSPIGDFVTLPLEDQINFFRTMVPEMQAAGFVFVFPVKEHQYSARTIGTLDTIRRQVSFYNAWRELYTNRTVLWCDQIECENAYPDSYTVRAEIVGAAESTNLGSGGISYILNDQDDPERRIAHLINHNYDGTTVVPQSGFTVAYDVPFTPVTVYMVSPDSSHVTDRVTLDYTFENGRVVVDVPELVYYGVVVVEGHARVLLPPAPTNLRFVTH